MVRILITGGSSSVGTALIKNLLLKPDVEIWCGRHRTPIPIIDDRLHILELNLESNLSALSGLKFDMVIHCAALTHSFDERRYWTMNVEATIKLAQVVHQVGCRDFVYISTRCATVDAGAYGASKLEAEQALRRFNWSRLLIIRPAEIYGANSGEGLDKMMEVAHKWRIVPWLFGNRNLRFAPLHIDDFGKLAVESILTHHGRVTIEHLCGPEDLTGLGLALRISRHGGALPLPLWWPLAAVCLKTLHKLGFTRIKPDQLQRLVATKTGTANERAKPQSYRERRFLLD